MNPLAWIGKALRWIGGLFAPMLVRPSLSPGLLWTLHLLLIAGVCVGLYYLQLYLNLTQHIRGLDYFPDSAKFFLPAVFLVIYLCAWLAWYVWKLFQPTEIISPFPDLDEAWNGVMEALNQAGIGIADTPVFVVIGRPRSGDAELFNLMPHGVAVKGGNSAASPLRVFANRDAIYLTCPGVTLLNRDAGTVVDEGPRSQFPTDGSISPNASIGIDGSIGMSGMGGGVAIQQVQQIIRKAQQERRSLTDHEKQIIRQLSGGAGPTEGGGGGATRASILQDAGEVERYTARMNYFCSLVAQARWPLCPINGAVIVLSIADTERDDVAQQLGLVAQKDLENMVDAMRLKFPVYSLLTDLNTLPGADLFLERFASDRRQQRLGKSFPLNPDMKPASVPDAVETNVNWIFSSLLPYWVFKLFRLETPNVESPNDASLANGELTQFLVAVRERAPKAARMVARAVMARAGELPSIGGCYLTTPEPGGQEPLFAQEFFKKVESTQGFVAWTDEAYALDAGYRRATKTGYFTLALIAAAVIALGVYVGMQKL